MASHVVVIDASFRRQVVKVTPGTYMTDVLEESCTKFGKNSSNYGLKHNTKIVDMSRTFRQTGLTSGAKLELIVASKTPSVVSIALQIPEGLASSVPGGRLMDKFPSNTTLWQILRKFEDDKERNLNFTARGVAQTQSGASGAGRVLYEMPSLNILGRDMKTFGDLQKTLAQVGLNSGSGLIRLTFRQTEQPIEEAMAEIGQYFKEEAEIEKIEAEASSTQPNIFTPEAIAKANDGASATGEVMSIGESSTTSADPSPYPNPVGDAPFSPPRESAPQPEPQTTIGPSQRPITVYSAPSGNTPQAVLQPYNEADYEPSPAHAKQHQEQLKGRSENKRLLSYDDEEKAEQEKIDRLNKIKNVTIAIRFPDQSRIESVFTSEDSAADLYSLARGAIIAVNEPFRLVWSNPKPTTIPDDSSKKLIKNLGFQGRSLVNFNWDDEASDDARIPPTLKPEYAAQARELQIQQIAATEENEPAVDNNGKGKETSGGGKRKGGIPTSWLKGLSKK